MEDKILLVILISLIPLIFMLLRDRELLPFALAGMFLGAVIVGISFVLTIWDIYKGKEYSEALKKAIQANKPLLCKDTIVRNPVLIEDKQIILDKKNNKAFNITDCEVFEYETGKD